MNSRRIHWTILAADDLWIVLALLTSLYLRYGNVWSHDSPAPDWGTYGLLLAVTIVGWLFLFEFVALDCFRGGWEMPAMISKTSMGVLLLMALILSWSFAIRMYYSRLVLCYFALLIWTGFVAIRLAVHAFLRRQQRAGKTRKVVLIGDGHLAHELVYRLQHHPELLFTIVGSLSPFGSAEASAGADAPCGGTGLSSLDALELLKTLGVNEVIVLPKYSPGIELQNFVVHCQREGIHVQILPQPYELYISRPKLVEIDGVPLISLEQPSSSKRADAIKRAMDWCLGAALLPPAIAIVSIACAFLWLRDRRFLRRELRCGRDGHSFLMYRLDIERDPLRAPRSHNVLRRLSISELPQLWNVFLGQMSLVGPRPEPPERVRHYSEWQRQRLRVRPGMTGLAQVNGLREQHSSEEKTRHDLQYILHWSPVLDLVLLVQTIWTLAGRLLSRKEERPAPGAAEVRGSHARESKASQAFVQ